MRFLVVAVLVVVEVGVVGLVPTQRLGGRGGGAGDGRWAAPSVSWAAAMAAMAAGDDAAADADGADADRDAGDGRAAGGGPGSGRRRGAERRAGARSPLLVWLATSYVVLLPLEVRAGECNGVRDLGAGGIGEQESPLEHIVQHPLIERPANLGPLTPNGVVTVFSDQIAMLVLAGRDPAVRRADAGSPAQGPGRRRRAGAPGSANAIEAICQYLRKEVAEPALHEHTDRFIRYIWSVFFFVLTVNLLGLLPIPGDVVSCSARTWAGPRRATSG